ALPNRFALETATDSGVVRNLVRALTPDGRRDSLIAGLTWRATPAATRVLLVANDVANTTFAQRSVAQGLAGGRAAAFAGVSAGRITRIDCR
ncbi:MAG: hypothetical protein ACREPM_18800, partial [Gemmatimonadaceae bacterium]